MALHLTLHGEHRMNAVPEQLVNMNKGAVQAWLDYAHLTAESTERFVDFQFRTSRAAMAELMETARALSGAKDAQEWVRLVTGATQPAPDRTVAYAQHVQAMLADVQKDFSKFFDGHVAEVNKNISSLMEQMSQNAPAGADVAVAAMKSALSAANQAYDAASKAGKQMSEVAEATLGATTPTGARKKAA